MRIIPIKDLKNTSEISELCHSTKEPVFITKNGYGDMVIMDIDTYERTLFIQDVFLKLDASEQDIADGRTKDAKESLDAMRKKYGI